jgi:tetratricopeptide (TPR) repeat protein
MERRLVSHYERFLALGNRYLESDKLEDAERAFASAVRQVYMLKNKVYEIAIGLRGLGFVYKARGSIHQSGEDLVKASGLFVASLTRMQECNAENGNRGNVKTDLDSEILHLYDEISNIHAIFIDEILQSQQDDSRSDFQRHEHYKESLQKIREFCQLKMSTLDDMPLLDPAARDISVEEERIEHTQQLYRDISISMKELITCMVDDCMQGMSSPPCKFSILGLGSTAREEATPYSDLEFCILVEKSTDTALQYFTDFTNFLHLKVVELGETILPSLGIQSLNDYYSGNSENDWFYDHGRRGFSFDGAMPWASKTPNGRYETFNKPWIQSLIKTPKDMASLLTETSIFKEGYHLADVLSTCSLICGNFQLFEEYTDFMREYIHETVDNCISAEVNIGLAYHVNPMPWKERILQELIEVRREYHHSLSNYVRKPGETYAVKTDIYRFPSLVVQYVGKYFDVQCSSSWQTIDKLVSAKILSPETAHNLRTVLCIAAELRLRTYLSSQCQCEYFNALVNRVQDLPDKLSSLLLRFFVTVVPLEEAIDKLPSESLLHVLNYELYNDDPKIKAQMYLQFRKYNKAEQILKDMLVNARHSSSNDDEDKKIAEMYKMLGNALFFQEHVSEAIKYHRKALEVNEQIYHRGPETDINMKRLADSCINYAAGLKHLGKVEEALSYYSKALEIRSLLLKRSSTAVNQIFYLQDIADVHFSLSVLYSDKTPADVDNFFWQTDKARDIAKILFEQYNITYYYHFHLLFNEGLFLYRLHRFAESAEAYQQAFELMYMHSKYDLFTDKEAGLLNNLGNAVIELGDFERARTLHNRAYEIRTHIHGANDDDSLARSLNNFGLINEREGKSTEAQEFYMQARDMSIRIHGMDSDDKFLKIYTRNAKRIAKKIKTS